MQVRPVSHAGHISIQLWLLVGSMVLIELVLSGADHGWIGAAGWRVIAFEHGAFWRPLLTGAEPALFAAQPFTMFLSHAFLHAGALHLAMNAVVLLSLGKFVSDRAGPWAMILLFVISAISGGAGFALLARTQGPMIGASGAVFGFLGLWQYWEARARRARGLTLRPVLSTLATLVVINVVLAIALQGGLAWQAHLGGFAAGVAMGPVMTRFARRRGAHAP